MGAFAAALAGVVAPAWATVPGTNGKLAFSAYGELYTVDPDGSHLTRVPRPSYSEEHNWSPAWSPDGQRLATGGEYLEPDPGPAGYRMWSETDLQLFGADGTGFVRFENVKQHANAAPSWSPDGTRLAYSSDVYGDVYTVKNDGTDPRPITRIDDGLGAGDPAWSPDGRRIAYGGQAVREGEVDIYTMAPDGSDVRHVTTLPGNEHSPSWSPDGRFLAFWSTYPATSENQRDIFVTPADGGSVVRLTDSPTDDFAPVWSPDGTEIAYEHVSTPDNKYIGELYVMDADGRNARRVTPQDCLQCEPDWQPIGFHWQAPDPPATTPTTTPTARPPASTPPSSSRGPAQAVAPAEVHDLTLTRRRFTWPKGARHVKLALTLSRDTRLLLSIERLKTGTSGDGQCVVSRAEAGPDERCTRAIRVMRVRRDASRGTTTLPLQALPIPALKSGLYRLTVKPTPQTAAAAQQQVLFRVIARPAR